MKLNLALPPGWTREGSAFGVLAACAALSPRYQIEAICPEPEALCDLSSFPFSDYVKYCTMETCSYGERDAVLLVPYSNGCASWTKEVLEQASMPTAIYVGEFDGRPRFWPDLAAMSTGLILPERLWADTLSQAEPSLPVLWARRFATPTPQDRAMAPPMPYLLTWGPALAESIPVILQAFAALRKSSPELQLVILGANGSPQWKRASRSFGIGRQTWLTDDPSIARTAGLIGRAQAIVAPPSPATGSTSLWHAWAQGTRRPMVNLTLDDDDWVALEAGYPQVSLRTHAAAHNLAHALSVMTHLHQHEIDALVSLQEQRLQDSYETYENQAQHFFQTVLNGGDEAPERSAQCTGLLRQSASDLYIKAISEATDSLDLGELTPDVLDSLASAIADLV